MLAAASNCGANNRASFPSSHSKMLCVYAATGYGIPYISAPPARESEYNFSTLGSTVEAWSNDNTKRRRSGSSIANPVATAIAASIVYTMRCGRDEYLNMRGRAQGCDRTQDEERNDINMGRLRKKTGISAMWRKIRREWQRLCWISLPGALVSAISDKDRRPVDADR